MQDCQSTKKKKKDSDNSSDSDSDKSSGSDSDEWDASSSDESSSDEEDERDKKTGRARWVKKNYVPKTVQKAAISNTEREMKRIKEAKERQQAAMLAKLEAAKAEKERLAKEAAEFTPAVLKSQLNQVIADRGKSGTDPKVQIAKLKKLCHKVSKQTHPSLSSLPHVYYPRKLRALHHGSGNASP